MESIVIVGVPEPVPTWETRLSPAILPHLADHRIDGRVTVSTADYVETALTLFGQDAGPCVLENVRFGLPVVLSGDAELTLRLSFDPDLRELSMHGRVGADDETWTSLAVVRRSLLADSAKPAPCIETWAEMTDGLPSIGRDEIYRRLDPQGTGLGPAFRTLDRVWLGDGEFLAEVEVEEFATGGYRLPPTLLDAVFQAFAIAIGDPEIVERCAPVRIGEMRFYRSPGRVLRIYGFRRNGELYGDFTLYTDDGEVVADLIGVRCEPLTPASQEVGLTGADRTSEWVWRSADAVDPGAAEGRWIVLGDSDLAARTAAGLTARGVQVRLLAMDRDWMTEILAEQRLGCRRLVHVPSLSPVREAVCDPLLPTFDLLLTLTEPMHVVILNYIAPGPEIDDPGPDLSAAPLWALGRAIRHRRPELVSRLIAVDVPSDLIIDELISTATDDVLIVQGKRLVGQMEPAGPDTEPQLVAEPGTPLRLARTGSGIEALGFVRSQRRPPGPREVEIEVAYTGVDVKDLAKVFGRLSSAEIEDTYSGNALGMECSGVIQRVGSAVTDFRAGDQVFVCGRDLFASYVTVDQGRVLRRPDGLSMAQTASLLPVLTAYVALVQLADVRHGERVLIHSAASGVGLAAVRVAKWLGAEIFATAGDETRREFLRHEEVVGASDSRSTTFFDDILSWTGSEGVDVVVNSIGGEIMDKSLELVRPFGRFVELGMSDLAADRKLRLGPFKRSISFHAFDVDQMMLLRPDLVRRHLTDVVELFDQEVFEPLPLLEIPASDIEAAFKVMENREYVGRVVVRFAGEQIRIPARTMDRDLVEPHKTYLVSGDLGLDLAGWLVDHGARHLVLVHQRFEADPLPTVEKFRAGGVEVRVEEVDLTNRQETARLLASVRADMPGLRGIFHTAAEPSERSTDFRGLSAEQFLAETVPHADSAWNLHLETATDDLRHFMSLAVIGVPLSPPRATACGFLHGLAHYRRAMRLPGMSVTWNPVDQRAVRLPEEFEALLRRNPIVVTLNLSEDLEMRRRTTS
ncbi:KR domain-containing protein [Kribbella sp. NPDC056861]|uniref:KR domain-containing protein n=1 Tax=Kribbella sp. NPDC056861 TaxID=3154857 RepID=UPI0034253784